MFQYQIVILTLVRFDSLHEDNEDACQPPFSQSLFKSQFATVPYTFLNLALIKPLIDLVIDLASRTPPVLHPSPNTVRGKKKKKESEFYVGSWNLEGRLGRWAGAYQFFSFLKIVCLNPQYSRVTIEFND